MPQIAGSWTPPTIETARLMLRGHGTADFDALAAMWADAEVVRHIGGHPSTEQESWARLLRYRGLWPVLGYGYWAVVERATGRFVGDMGLADFRREVSPSIRGIPEAGWVLASWAQGRGFAREAMGAVLAWFDRQDHARSVCLIAPENAASLRLAGRLGYREETRLRFHDQPTLLLSRKRSHASRY